MFESIREQHFPCELVPGITARALSYEELTPILDAIADQLFGSLAEAGNYELPLERYPLSERLTEVYSQSHAEQFVFETAAGEPVGWSTGVMVDDTTFFMRYSGVLPTYQRRGIYGAFLRAFLPYLRALGYERVTSSHMVNNRAVLIAKLKAGFVITGLVLDERYGAQAQLTYFFYEDRRAGFARAYSVYAYPGTPEYGAPVIGAQCSVISAQGPVRRTGSRASLVL